MSRIRKEAIHRAIVRAADLLDRNADPADTFQGVLGVQDARALNVLIALALRFVCQEENTLRQLG
jgi:hypothetical protein